MTKAAALYLEYKPSHSDMMDLVGHANVKMLEAMPNALASTDPVAYLMSVSAYEMKRYCMYHDPLVKRPVRQAQGTILPTTFSLDERPRPYTDTVAGAEVYLVSDEERERMNKAEAQLVYEALGQLTENRRKVLCAYYGLNGEPALKIKEIAEMLQIKTGAVKDYLRYARYSLGAKLAPYIIAEGKKNAQDM